MFGSDISSKAGMEVSHKPMRPSQEDVNSLSPSECTDESGAVCRCKVAKTLEDEDSFSENVI
jgi:hypothetical protein